MRVLDDTERWQQELHQQRRSGRYSEDPLEVVERAFLDLANGGRG